MKRLVIATLSALTLANLGTPAFANKIAAVNRTNASNITEITPFNLVTGSYQGRFANQGIPSYNAFLRAIRTNKIEATDLVKSAIAAGRLSEDTLKDTEYLNSVDALLDGLDEN